MYCNKCGKEIQDNKLFCINCGEKIEKSINILSRTGNNFGLSKGIMIINNIIMIIVGLGFICTANKWNKSNSNVFSLFSSSSQSFGELLHWGICIFFCFQSIFFIYFFTKKLSASLTLISGLLLLFEAFVFWMFQMLNNEWSHKFMPLLLYRLFGKTYSNMIGILFVMGIFLIIIGGVMKSNSKD